MNLCREGFFFVRQPVEREGVSKVTDDELKRDPIYKEYTIARDSIQLLRAYVTRCDAERGPNEKLPAPGIGIGLQFMQRHRWKDETTAEGDLLAKVTFGPKQDKDAFILKAHIEVRGIFKAKEAPKDKQKIDKQLALQLVPQLIPYARGAVMTVAALMGIPASCELIPTMDILKSIRKNRDHD